MRYFDWEKLQRYINRNHFSIKIIDVGIKEDWFSTADTVYSDGAFIKNVAFDHSLSGTPVFKVKEISKFGKYNFEFECWQTTPTTPPSFENPIKDEPKELPKNEFDIAIDNLNSMIKVLEE